MYYPVNTNTLQAVSCQIGSRNNQSGPYILTGSNVFSADCFPAVSFLGFTLYEVFLLICCEGVSTLFVSRRVACYTV